MNIYEKALQKIKEDERCKPNFCCSIIEPTGATGPQDGPNSGASIARTGASSFNLSEIG